MTGSRFLAFLRLTRPIFLLGGVMMYGLGLAWAADDLPRIDLLAALVGQVMVTATQLVAQYANEYYDHEADLNNPNRTHFSGGSGVFAAGQLQRIVALRAARACAAVAALAIIFLAFRAPVAAAIGVAGLLGAWFYSAPPLSLAGRGWGEIEASILVTILVPYAAYATQSGWLSPSLILACAPLFFLHMAMLIAFSLPDRETDAAVGKNTLAVRLGPGACACAPQHYLAHRDALACLVGGGRGGIVVALADTGSAGCAVDPVVPAVADGSTVEGVYARSGRVLLPCARRAPA